MDQQVRFCRTTDGVRIAYATVGQGPAIVFPGSWVTHLELEWDEEPAWRAFLEAYAHSHTIVRYDRQGCGLSDRDRTDFSLESEMRPLEAVVDHLKLRHFTLFGVSAGGPTAVGYAVRHPRRVAQLVLYGTTPGPVSQQNQELVAAFQALIRAHWGIASKTLADMFLPGGTSEAVERLAWRQREAATAEMAAELIGRSRHIDVRDLLPRVRVPTLVLHRRDDQAQPFEGGRELAAAIPNARFVPLEGRIHMMFLGDVGAVFRALENVLGPVDSPVSAEPAMATPAGHVGGRLLTILFTDIAASTALTRRLGDAGAREVLRAHERVVREQLQAHEGTEIKALGDGFMASFGSASQALAAAIAIQQAVTAANSAAAEPLHVRVGLNAGEPIAEDADLFGTAVNLAARIAAQATAGQILVANVVRELAAGKGFLFADQGDVVLRGFEDPVRVYEVAWGDGA
jgi:class 3 adenylate cyclase/pimeloyl-ACP methyl ester carboxylesterase